MSTPPVLIKNIFQKDNFNFTIVWSDGISFNYRLSELQKRCPCAKCYDPGLEKSLVNVENIDENVRAKHIKSVGRYALKIHFTSGCSAGIYNFNMLRKMINI